MQNTLIDNVQQIYNVSQKGDMHILVYIFNYNQFYKFCHFRLCTKFAVPKPLHLICHCCDYEQYE